MTDEQRDDLPAKVRKGRSGPDAALPRPVQEHLARQLRAAYHERQEKPAFLGDAALPREFDDYLYRLWSSETAHRRRRAGACGLAAVQAALKGVGA
ncbi:hypothetical protein [Microvirga massiliensis]|uniref:hypothetical protein n=1 Tax=Microvirga massiliensis TaxID=1033741 RepID=UPI000B2E4BB8|nr:hypothetical protein [Microvirga massiliensis]